MLGGVGWLERTVTSMEREKTRIAMLIVVAIVAIALAMLEALAG
jgi:hypothetical protein